MSPSPSAVASAVAKESSETEKLALTMLSLLVSLGSAWRAGSRRERGGRGDEPDSTRFRSSTWTTERILEVLSGVADGLPRREEERPLCPTRP